MPLLKESRMNHLGKLMFQWFYWHALLQGRDVPGIGADMPEHGKERDTTHPKAEVMA
jgi:sulfide:quinone oxidoreductase